MNLVYKHRALVDMQQMKAYIEDVLKNKAAASNFTRRLLKRIDILKKKTLLGVSVAEKFSIESDLRMLIIERQLVFYEISNKETITIIRVLDSRQDYLAILLGSDTL